MSTLKLRGRITEEGRLEVDLPSGIPAGEARVTIEVPPTEGWSSQEIAEALKIEPLTGAEIVAAGLAGGWEGIEDGAAWVDRRRRQRRERLQ
jgi:hypothetical protein